MINIIVAYDKNNAIGKDNKLVWRQSNDLKRFKLLTTDQIVVMGRKTYDSIGRALPKRINIVISRNNIDIDNVKIINSIDLKEVIKESIDLKKEIFILGGGEIYKQLMPVADYIYATEIDAEIDADTWFPKIDMNNWEIESSEEFLKDEVNEFNYKFVKYKRNGSNRS